MSKIFPTSPVHSICSESSSHDDCNTNNILPKLKAPRKSTVIIGGAILVLTIALLIIVSVELIFKPAKEAGLAMASDGLPAVAQENNVLITGRKLLLEFSITVEPSECSVLKNFTKTYPTTYEHAIRSIFNISGSILKVSRCLFRYTLCDLRV
jgi:hypothetical protein